MIHIIFLSIFLGGIFTYLSTIFLLVIDFKYGFKYRLMIYVLVFVIFATVGLLLGLHLSGRPIC